MRTRSFIAVAWIFSFSLVACEDILEVPDISGQSVNLLAPSDGSVLDDNSVNLNWEGVEEATGYSVQVASPNFENAAQILLDSVIEMDTLGYLPNQIRQHLFNGNYEWRVKAFNSGFETIYSSNGFQVNGDKDFDLTPPNTPQLISPANGSDTSDTEIGFAWSREDVPGTVERDSIFIYSDENLQELTTKAVGANKSYTTTLCAGTYYWLVRAFDTAGNESGYSSTFNFTIND
ncbi:hypothetical protein GUA46_06955 [Muricauda sp. HICW]|uniref:Fibronectin type-III domain-containing protein n=1 Tax=Flagellimonas chongwuensis TaxID=2697365 RepID=A0A850NBM2_9FLAO|nr:hypothetical protein [Allomuricauda chongwuensis]NVN18073.1 hypothetical protein [Allomuricauda chongwuensis]